MSEDSEVVYVAGLARIFGKTEASIRDGIRRNADWLPKGFRMSGRHAWLREDVLKFLREYRDGEHKSVRP